MIALPMIELLELQTVCSMRLAGQLSKFTYLSRAASLNLVQGGTSAIVMGGWLGSAFAIRSISEGCEQRQMGSSVWNFPWIRGM